MNRNLPTVYKPKSRGAGYLPAEIEIIIKAVQAGHSNLSVAYEQASRDLAKKGYKRTPGAIAAQWSKVIRPQLDSSDNAVFALAGKNTMLVNRKNAMRKSADDDIISVHDIVREYTKDMNKEQRMALIRTILESQ